MTGVAMLDLVGATAAVLTTGCWLPQALRIIRTRDARAISLPATAAFVAGIALWLLYGIGLANWPLIVANAVTLSLMLVILGLKLRYG